MKITPKLKMTPNLKTTSKNGDNQNLLLWEYPRKKDLCEKFNQKYFVALEIQDLKIEKTFYFKL